LRAQETWAWGQSQPQQQLIVRTGQQEQQDIVLAPGTQPYLIAFQPAHKLFSTLILYSLKRLVTQKFSKFSVILREREPNTKNKTCNNEKALCWKLWV
jgi:hypothetical protein